METELQFGFSYIREDEVIPHFYAVFEHEGNTYIVSEFLVRMIAYCGQFEAYGSGVDLIWHKSEPEVVNVTLDNASITPGVLIKLIVAAKTQTQLDEMAASYSSSLQRYAVQRNVQYFGDCIEERFNNIVRFVNLKFASATQPVTIYNLFIK